MSHPILKKLAGGDRRSICRSNRVVSEVLARPVLFKALLEGISSKDPIVRMRAAAALEEVTVQRPDLLLPHKSVILRNRRRDPSAGGSLAYGSLVFSDEP